MPYTNSSIMKNSFMHITEAAEDCKFIKKRLKQSCFPVNIAKFLRTAFLIEHL